MKGMAGFSKRCDVGHRGFGDCRQCVARKETLMARDQDVRKSQEALEDIVADHFVRFILEEQRGLLLVDVESHVADRPAFDAH
jgi:hypothetical protein